MPSTFLFRAGGDQSVRGYGYQQLGVREGDAIVFTHTQVPPALEGQGVGSRLIAGALAQVREAGLKVVPACSFVAAYVQRHPEAADLA